MIGWSWITEPLAKVGATIVALIFFAQYFMRKGAKQSQEKANERDRDFADQIRKRSTAAFKRGVRSSEIKYRD